MGCDRRESCYAGLARGKTGAGDAGVAVADDANVDDVDAGVGVGDVGAGAGAGADGAPAVPAVATQIVEDAGKKMPVAAEHVSRTVVHYLLASRVGEIGTSDARDRVDAGSVKVSDGCLLVDYTRTSG